MNSSSKNAAVRRNVHFVGSLGLADAETAFRTQAKFLGSKAKRYTDGEHGPRQQWIRFQMGLFDTLPDLERVASTKAKFGGEKFDRPVYAPRAGVEPAEFDFGHLGYADEAIESFETFRRLKSQGVIPAATRFQVSLPTPAAVIWGFIHGDCRIALEPAYENAMLGELKRITGTIPHDELSIQFDVCQETLAQDNAVELYYDDTDFRGTVERLNRLADAVPEPVELGFHLCYGDAGHKHAQEPADLGTCVEIANRLVKHCVRPFQWIHMPVPRDREDDTYFLPLERLSLPGETELVIGCVHHTDGLEGTKRRMAAAAKHAAAFGIATECGFGRREPSTLDALFQIHADAVDDLKPLDRAPEPNS